MEVFSQFGLTGLTLGILFFIVKHFVKTIENKDKYIQDLIREHYKHLDELSKRHEEITGDYIREGIDSRAEHTNALKELIACVSLCPQRGNFKDLYDSTRKSGVQRKEAAA